MVKLTRKYKKRTLKKYGKKTHSKKQSKNKRRNGKKTRKRHLKKKKGGDGKNTMPIRENYQSAKEFFEAYQEFRRKQAEKFNIEPTSNSKKMKSLENCENVQNNNDNEIGEIEKDEYVFKFKFQTNGTNNDKIYCYSESQMKHTLNNLTNIQSKWSNKENIRDNDNIDEQEKLRRQQGYGSECQIANPIEYFNNIFDDENEMKNINEIDDSDGKNNFRGRYLYWNSIINVRTWISEEGVKVINDNRGKPGFFVLKKQDHQTIIGNLFNVFGIGMIHGQKPGEFIHDIEFIPENNDTPNIRVCSLLNKYELTWKYSLLWNTYYDSPVVDDLNTSNLEQSFNGTNGAYDPNDDSFASSVYPDDDPEIAGQLFENEHSPDDDIVGINLFGVWGNESTNSSNRRNVESYGDNRMTLSELDTSDIHTTPPITSGPSQESETPRGQFPNYWDNSDNTPSETPTNTISQYANTFEPYNTP